MCQAFGAEQEYVFYQEQQAALKGFKAAVLGSDIDENPHSEDYSKYQWQSWKHGWNCFHEFMWPWAAEEKIREELGIPEAMRLSVKFKKEEVLPEKVKDILGL